MLSCGDNYYGQLGHPRDTRRLLTPREVTVVDNGNDGTGVRFVDISAGRFHGLALSDAGQVFAFGYGTFDGRLGFVSTPSSGQADDECQFGPRQVRSPSLEGVVVVGISAGFAHSLAVSDEGKVFAFGLLGQTTTTTDNTTAPSEPQRVESLGWLRAGSVSAGFEHSLITIRHHHH